MNKNKHTSPIGTIISSVLNYETFLKINELKNTPDLTEIIWIPCDGRNIKNSKYGKHSGGLVPDLRGVFLRGINDYDNSFPGVTKVNPDQANPENTNAGIFQQEEIKSHKHTGNMNLGAEPRGGGARSNRAAGSHGSVTPNWTSPKLVNEFGGNETRPKNVTVFFYIRIN